MWAELAQRGLIVRPFSSSKPHAGGRHSQFRAGLRDTLKTLTFEMEQLDAKTIVVELEIDERHIRLDGYPRADARVQSSAVAISFESKHGPLRYATDEFSDWHDNLRAIALSMHALRAVDRYGVSKRGEQYAGWKALPVSTDPADAIQTEEDAWRVLTSAAGVASDSSPLRDGISESEVVRRALFATHPDRGGDPDEFRRVQRSREILGC